MAKPVNYIVIVLFVLFIGVVVGYAVYSGIGSTGMATKKTEAAESQEAEAVAGSCLDSDKGYDWYTLGYVEYNGETYIDRCSENVLYEAGCVDNRAYTRSYECPNGCSVGSCIR